MNTLVYTQPMAADGAHAMARKQKNRAAQPADTTGMKIRAEREAQGLTLEQVADELGISAQALQRYETSARKISIEMLVRIAEVLGAPPARFIEGGDGLTDWERCLISDLRDNPMHQKVISSTWQGLRSVTNGD